jgi:hypothetical protein
VKLTVKAVPDIPNRHRGGRCIALNILKPHARRVWVVSPTRFWTLNHPVCGKSLHKLCHPSCQLSKLKILKSLYSNYIEAVYCKENIKLRFKTFTCVSCNIFKRIYVIWMRHEHIPINAKTSTFWHCGHTTARFANKFVSHCITIFLSGVYKRMYHLLLPSFPLTFLTSLTL